MMAMVLIEFLAASDPATPSRTFPVCPHGHGARGDWNGQGFPPIDGVKCANYKERSVPSHQPTSSGRETGAMRPSQVVRQWECSSCLWDFTFSFKRSTASLKSLPITSAPSHLQCVWRLRKTHVLLRTRYHGNKADC